MHLTVQEAFGIPPKELAMKLSRLRYDELAKLSQELSFRLAEDAEKDKQRGRFKLSRQLERIAETLASAGIGIEVAWEICKPFMKLKAPV